MRIEHSKKGELTINGKRFKGKIYDIKGHGEVELFRIGALAAALERDNETLIQWEKQGLLPKPLFNVVGDKTHRWYSREQILNIRHVWEHLPYRKGRPDYKDRFFTTVRKVWTRLTIVTIRTEGTHERRASHHSSRREGVRAGGMESTPPARHETAAPASGTHRPEDSGTRTDASNNGE